MTQSRSAGDSPDLVKSPVIPTFVSSGYTGYNPSVANANYLTLGQVNLEPNDQRFVLDESRGIVSAFTFAPALHVHYHVANQTSDNSAIEQGSYNIVESLEKSENPTTLAMSTMVALPAVLRCSGLVVLAFVFICIIGNVSSPHIILNPFVALIVAVSGFGLFAMSYGK